MSQLFKTLIATTSIILASLFFNTAIYADDETAASDTRPEIVVDEQKPDVFEDDELYLNPTDEVVEIEEKNDEINPEIYEMTAGGAGPLEPGAPEVQRDLSRSDRASDSDQNIDRPSNLLDFLKRKKKRLR